jgi:hypothetical protein
MEEQSYAKHAKFVPLYHIVTFAIIFVTLIGSIANLVRTLQHGSGRIDAALITGLSLAAVLLFVFARTFPLKAQDRVIRAEENMRHFVMTGKPLDSRLTLKQIIGLRFASDGEFVALAKRAADENMSMDDIKRAVKSWRVDSCRM